MNLDDKFDKTIKQKISEAEFPFDESNWEKASRMIDAERGVSVGFKSSKLFLLIGTLFLGVAAGTFGFLYLGHDQDENKITMTNKLNQENSSVRAEQFAENTTGAEKINKEVSETKTENSLTEATNDSGSSTDNSNNSPSASGKSGSNTNLPSLAANHSFSDSESNESQKTSHGNSGIDNAAKMNESAKADPFEKTTAKSGTKSNNYKKQRQVLGSKTSDKKDAASNSNVIDMELLNAANAVEQEVTTSDYLEMHSSVLQLWQKEEVLRNSPHDFIRIYDEEYYKKSRKRLHFINLDAGAAYMLGWESAKGNDAAGLNYYAGINYGLYIKKKMSITIGAQFYNISHIKNPFYSRQNLQYDFGYNGNYTNITSNELMYVGIPVKVYRNISRTGKVGFGVNTAFLVDSRNSVQTFTERDLVKSNIQTVQQKGNFEGVNTMNFMLSANYNQRLSRRFFLNAEFVYGLSDTYNKSTTLNNTRENNMGIRLGIQYTLFER